MDALRILVRSLRYPPMRRLQVASASWSAGDAAYLVGLYVFMYAVGGAGSVALVAIVRTVPSIVLAPLVAAIASGHPADRALRTTLVVRLAIVAGLAWVVGTDGPLLLAYALAIIDSLATNLSRALRATMLPAVSRSPGELVAGNVATTTGEAIATLVGPALAAIALLGGEPVVTFVPALVLFGVALLVAWGLHVSHRDVVRRRRRPMAHPAEGPPSAARWLMTSPARSVIAGFTAQRFLRGALTVLLVAAAIDLLGMGDPGVGVLTAAIGVGGLAGGAVALSATGSRRLVPWFAAGIVLWSAGIGQIGAIPLPVVAVVGLAVAGIGKVLVDVAGYTLLQRTVPNALRTRVLGIQEGFAGAALAGGSLAASWLIGSIGIAPATVLLAAIPLVLVVLLWRPLSGVDDAVVIRESDLHLLRSNQLFEPLSMATIEELAAGLGRRTVAAGDPICHQGHPGDHYFGIESGEVQVSVDGRPTERLGAGDWFGEIALIRDVPRTATVIAETEVRLATVERSRFLDAVTGDPLSTDAAERLIERRLATAPG
jgi:Cyclic nucleotide-binding domain